MPLIGGTRWCWVWASCLQIAYNTKKQKEFAITFATTTLHIDWWDVRGSNPRQTD